MGERTNNGNTDKNPAAEQWGDIKSLKYHSGHINLSARHDSSGMSWIERSNERSKREREFRQSMESGVVVGDNIRMSYASGPYNIIVDAPMKAGSQLDKDLISKP